MNSWYPEGKYVIFNPLLLSLSLFTLSRFLLLPLPASHPLTLPYLPVSFLLPFFSFLPIPLVSFPPIESSLLLAGKCSLDLLESQFVPLLEELRERAISIWQDEHYLYATKSSEGSDTQTQKVEALNEVRSLMTQHDLVVGSPS